MADQYCLLDTETTGLDPEHNGIIELAAEKIIVEEGRFGVPVGHKHFHTLVRPAEGHGITDAALEVNKHYWCKDPTSQQYKNAMPYTDAWDAFYAWLKKNYEKPEWLIMLGWNPSFDEAFLRYMHSYPNVPGTAGNAAYVRSNWPFHYHKIDFISLARYLDIRAGRSRRTYKLEKMAEHFFGAVSNFAMHTALGDARMALTILHRMEDDDESRRPNGVAVPRQPTTVADRPEPAGSAGQGVSSDGEAAQTREG
jgi:DNA polymerase III epsilon subunit-like protein